jgi:hypothetical protein
MSVDEIYCSSIFLDFFLSALLVYVAVTVASPLRGKVKKRNEAGHISNQGTTPRVHKICYINHRKATYPPPVIKLQFVEEEVEGFLKKLGLRGIFTLRVHFKNR